MMEKRDFSEFLSELIVLSNEVASFAKNPEIEIDAFDEFAMLVEKFAPIFNDLRDKSTIMGKPAIRKSLESIENELNRAKALIRSPYLKEPVKQIEDITRDLGRSFGLLIVASLEVSTDFREKIGVLQKQLMNARFGGYNTSLTSSPVSNFVRDVKVEGEIEEEIVNVIVTLEDVVLQLKNGSAEEFAVVLMRLKKLIRDGQLDSGLINENFIVCVLFNRLSSCKAEDRLTVIQLLRSIALGNDESKEKMANIEFLSALVKSLIRGEEERRETVGLLLELSDLAAVRRQIGRIKGCILMLTSILNGIDPVASHDAAKLLDILSSNSQNALHMAAAGYFRPLVHYLEKGSDMNKILMATSLSRLVLTDHCKLSLGQEGAVESLVKMFNSGKLESKLSALNALQNLSSLTENVQRLVKTGIVGYLLQLLFSVTSVLMTLREPASAMLARIAQSESFLVNQDAAQQMLSLLSLNNSKVIQGHLLEALDSIASHPGASKVRRKMKEKGALQLILPLLKETKIRSKALSLLYTLSKDLTEEFSEHLDQTHLLNIVNIVISTTSDNEKANAVGILSNLPVNDKKVTDMLKRANLLPMLVHIMDSSTGSNSLTRSIIAESIAGIVIRFTCASDKKLQLLSAEQGVIPLLVKVLSGGSTITKFRAATSLAQLSQNSLPLRRSWKSRWLCASHSVNNAYCEVHDGYCFVNSTFCLIKAGAVSPLIQILVDKDEEAVEASLSALSTLLQDEIWEGGVKCIAELSGVDPIVKILETGNLKVQEKALWMLERIFRVDGYRVKYGESAEAVLIDLAQKNDSGLKPTVAKVLALLELLQAQSSYF